MYPSLLPQRLSPTLRALQIKFTYLLTYLYGYRTAAVVEFEKTAPSVQYKTLASMMKSRFHEVIKEKDHVLGDKLKALSRFNSDFFAACWLHCGFIRAGKRRFLKKKC